MVDIPLLIEKKRNEELARYAVQLRLLIASNNRAMEDEDFQNFVRNLTKNLEDEDSKTEQNKLDRNKLEALRLMTNMGANKTGGR